MAFVLKLGIRNAADAVKAVQGKLIVAGHLAEKDPAGTSNQDGVFGRLTQDAVIRFQAAKGLVADGLVGPDTSAALGLETPKPAALPQQKHVLTQQQLRKLAELVDGLIPTGPVDFFDDRVIVWLVEKLDGALASLLPPHVLAWLNDLSNGIDSGDLVDFKRRLVTELNKRVNVPLLSEAVEEKIIGFVVGLVVEALQVGRTFDSAIAVHGGQVAR